MKIAESLPIPHRVTAHLGFPARLGKEFIQIGRIADPRTVLRYFLNFIVESPRVLRTRHLYVVDRKMAGHRAWFRVCAGRKVLLDDHFAGAREIYTRRVYSARGRFRLSPGETVVDLGANAGLFTTMAAVCGCRVIAVDALSAYEKLISHNLSLNGCGQNARFQLALLGEGTGVYGDTSVLRREDEFGRDPDSMSIPDLLSKFNITHVHLLKVDVEGSEFGAFQGDTSFLGNVDRIAMEVHPTFGNPQILVELFRSSGFTVELCSSDLKVVEQIEGPSGYLYAFKSAPA